MSSSPNTLNPNRAIRTFLDRIERQRFFGTVTVRYENGTAMHVRREESILPSKITESDASVAYDAGKELKHA
jgi:hypothetical protein